MVNLDDPDVKLGTSNANDTLVISHSHGMPWLYGMDGLFIQDGHGPFIQDVA